jgi:hypothetical protein
VALVDPWAGAATTTTASESAGVSALLPGEESGSATGWPARISAGLTTTTSSITTATTPAATPDFVAHLSGAESVPPVDTLATGVLSLTLAPDGNSVQYVLAVTNAFDLTMAALCQGEAGSNGARVFTLRNDLPVQGVFSGVVARGTITADMLFGPLEDKTMADFVALAKDGLLFVKAGTSANPWGEIRGQIEAVP